MWTFEVFKGFFVCVVYLDPGHHHKNASNEIFQLHTLRQPVGVVVSVVLDSAQSVQGWVDDVDVLPNQQEFVDEQSYDCHVQQVPDVKDKLPLWLNLHQLQTATTVMVV